MWWLFLDITLFYFAIEMIDDEKVKSSVELNIPGELTHFLNPIYSFKHVDDEEWFYKFSISVMKSISWCVERQMTPETDEVEYLYIELQTMEFYGVWPVLTPLWTLFIKQSILTANKSWSDWYLSALHGFIVSDNLDQPQMSLHMLLDWFIRICHYNIHYNACVSSQSSFLFVLIWEW